MAKTTKPDRHGDGPVGADELAEIARHLRAVLGEAEARALPVVPDAAAAGGDRPARPATAMLRFAASFVLPGLVLIAIVLARGIAP